LDAPQNYCGIMTLKNSPGIDRQNLQILFSNNYNIPAFQREYTWEKANVESLIDDLDDLIGNENFYFLGQIVVTQAELDEFKRSSIVDGQQRLLTIQLLLNYLYKRMMNSSFNNLENRTEQLKSVIRSATDDGGFELRIRMSQEGETIFRRLINNEELPPQTRAVTLSQKNLIGAYDQIKESLDDKDDDYINYLQRGLRERTILTKLTIGTLGEALEVFEKINHRGVKLGDTDLLKNYLFRSLDDSQFKQVSTTWNRTSQKIFDLKPKRVASLNLLLRSELVARTGLKVSTDGLLSAWDSYLRDPQSGTSALDFVNDLPTISDAYCNFSKRKIHENLPFDSGRALGEFNSVQHFPILLAARNMANEQLEFLMEIVEQRVLLSLFSNEGPQNFEKIVPAWANAIWTLARTNRSPSRQELLRASSKALEGLEDLWSNFVIRFRRLSYHSDKRKIKYVLARVAGQLESERGVHFDYEDLLRRQISLDHIESQNSQRFMREDFLASEFGSGELSETALSEYRAKVGTWLHSIGNLAPIALSSNSSMSDLEPSEKIPYYKADWALNMVLCPAEAIQIPVGTQRTRFERIHQEANLALSSWGPKMIEKRTEYLLRIFAKSLTHMQPELLPR
jgi:hypothetical protein